MSGNLPFEIQEEIIKRLPVKSLIQFRSVCKVWKSLIESSQFIAHYSSQHTQVQHLLATYEDEIDHFNKYVLIADDDTFPHQKLFPTVPLLIRMLDCVYIIGCSQGLICLVGFYLMYYRTRIAVIWNRSIGKAVPVVVPNLAHGDYETDIFFGVCRETNDPKIVRIININRLIDMKRISCIRLQVEVFTLSTRAWRRSYINLPCNSIQFSREHVAVNGYLYWLAEDTITMDNEIRFYKLVISFDTTTEEFREINLPDTLAHQFRYNLSISKRKESLVVVEHNVEANNHVFCIWMMEDGSFAKLFTFNVTAVYVSVRGFRKNGEPIIEISEDLGSGGRLFVYEPYLKQINTLGIDRIRHSSSVYPYMETLLLLDQPNFKYYTEKETRKYLDDLVS